MKKATQWYSVFASGPGIFGLGNRVYADDAIFAAYDPSKTDLWSIENPDHVNGGINHFGSPFNFPEEFVTVYRLHTMVPDLIELPAVGRRSQPRSSDKVPVVDTFRGPGDPGDARAGPGELGAVHGAAARWACSRCRTIRSSCRTSRCRGWAARRGKIDVAALDLIRDRERGVPRFNEFRRQYGLRQLTSFDDFIDTTPGPRARRQRAEQARLVGDPARGLRAAPVRRLARSSPRRS